MATTPQVPVNVNQDPGLRRPWYGIGFAEAYLRSFMKYTIFTGRASRGEFWWWWLGNFVIVAILGACATGLGVDWLEYRSNPGIYTTSMPLNAIGVILTLTVTAYVLFSVLPSLAVACRRLHDTNRTGRWLLLFLLPVVGWIWLLVLLARRTYQAPTRWDYAVTALGSSPYSFSSPARPRPRRSY